jgi:type IV secretory pathway ATPase VirB11/archaellum biosynthesis ATPase
MSDEQTREWIENLHSLKGANLALLRRWARNLRPRPNHILQLELTDEDSQTLVTVLNDHRLMCAARYDIGEAEMNLRTLTELQNVAPRRRMALVDIMFLASIIETVLALLPGNYGDWPAYAR